MATSSLAFRSEIVKEKKNKRVSAKSIAARQVRWLSKTWAVGSEWPVKMPIGLSCLT